jgi:hypothetical protein
MIVYSLDCPNGHFFEGWFASADACERQRASGQLACPTCASANVRKLPSAPHVHASASAPAPRAADGEAGRREALGALRQLVLANTEDVGRQFAEIARRIHYKEEDARGIRGHVTAEEAAELREEGVQTHSLPAGFLGAEEVQH